MSTYRSCLVGLAGLVLLAPPARADTCGPAPCTAFESLDLLTPAVPADGVLVLQPTFAADAVFDADAVASAVVVVVTRGDAQVDGEAQALAEHGVVIWRPAAPLVVGADYRVRVDVDELAPGGCGAAAPDGEWTLAVLPAHDGLPPPTPAAPSVVGTLSLAPVHDLDTDVCCDGAYPVLESQVCDIVAWDTGHCAAARERGDLDVVATLAPDDLAAAGWVVHRFADRPVSRVSGDVAFRVDEPGCGRVVATDLVTGRTATGPEVCFGDDVAASLGEHPFDPADELARSCGGEPYVCERDLVAWDPEACAAYDGQPRVDSCFVCGASAGAPPWALALALLLRRRRR